tara:strand:- start:12039 stop:12245 length:207 start_codon:yes stop_codon:yes gene_type:complete
MFDVMARRYSKLPSEILREADSFDMMVMDVAQTYEQYLDAKNNKKGVGEFVNQGDLEAYHKKVTSKSK